MIRSPAVLALVLGTAVVACRRTPPPEAAPSSRVPVADSTPAADAPESNALAPGSSRVERIDRVPAPEPTGVSSARAPSPDPLVLPAGTTLQLRLERGLSSATSRAGDAVTARVERATGPDGRVLLPGGTVLHGRVYRAEAAGRVSGRSRLAVDFDRIVVRGATHRLETTAIDVRGPASHERDAAIVGGSTLGGAILGGIFGGGSGAKKGALVGVLGGTGAVLATRGREVEIPSGSRWTVRVRSRVAMS
jgi:type IV secretory pathway VirB10-like protein